MQPLQYLREYTCNNKPVTLKDADGKVVTNIADAVTVSFDDQSFPRETATNFRKSGSTDTYTLDTLIFLVQNSHLDNSAYFKECRSRNIEHVSIIDKKKVMDYLTGKVETQPNIVADKESTVDQGVIGKRPREEGADALKSTSVSAVSEAKGKESADREAVKKKVKIFDVKTEETVKKIRTREVPSQTRTTVMRGTKDFTYVISMVQSVMYGKDGRLNTGQSKSTNKAKLSSKDKIPLIIVPAAPTAKFTLFNIKQFLEDSNFVDAQQLRAQGMKKPDRVTVERRRRDGQLAVYHIVDSVSNFKQSDWDRVCCVFTGGQAWQFKGWKYEKPVDLFSHVKGVYPKWSDEKVTGPVADWAVTPLNIHRHQRHQDKACVSQFWDTLDKYNHANKSFLNY
ncbi:RNA pol II accessory factor, Cdc73 family-domain-containing protein [Zychaea mexicana]|uniref:RNA pol II accessory factor, Cdc73 family-domain-containing protein n=1 Tax=Zychaea mexicana TaxID=64656 RepID=UPI0022FEB59C|nr:RNA pol II accessory factor, Cdc73 family-domain-containing protein [Zychaea mexicana]KAI9498791.1 RNA pol II accessory factor, Cdc73 family-domain-containing protein [Zychaea mexicana]